MSSTISKDIFTPYLASQLTIIAILQLLAFISASQISHPPRWEFISDLLNFKDISLILIAFLSYGFVFERVSTMMGVIAKNDNFSVFKKVLRMTELFLIVLSLFITSITSIV